MPKQVRNRKQFSRAASRPSPDWEFHWPLLDWLLQFLKPAPRPRGPTILFDLPQARSRQTHSPLCQRNGKAAPLQWGQPSGSRLGGAATEQRRQGADQQREPRGHDGRGSAGHRAGGPLRRDGGLGRGVAGTPAVRQTSGALQWRPRAHRRFRGGQKAGKLRRKVKFRPFRGFVRVGLLLNRLGGVDLTVPVREGGVRIKPNQSCMSLPRIATMLQGAG